MCYRDVAPFLHHLAGGHSLRWCRACWAHPDISEIDNIPTLTFRLGLPSSRAGLPNDGGLGMYHLPPGCLLGVRQPSGLEVS